jgi:thiaminase
MLNTKALFSSRDVGTLLAYLVDASLTYASAFFMENSDRWKDQYEKANEIFRKSCQGEIDFWEAVLNSGA